MGGSFRITEYQVGRDLNDHLVQPFLAEGACLTVRKVWGASGVSIPVTLYWWFWEDSSCLAPYPELGTVQRGEESPWEAAYDTVFRTSLGSPMTEPLWPYQGYLVTSCLYERWKRAGSGTGGSIESPATCAACSARANAQHEAAKRVRG